MVGMGSMRVVVVVEGSETSGMYDGRCGGGIEGG